MTLATIDIRNVRNIEKASVTPSSTINLLVGENASGKSSFLEAIYLLGRGKSFRSRNYSHIVSAKSEYLAVNGQTLQASGQVIRLGIKIEKQKRDISVSGNPAKQSADLAYALPVQLIHPNGYVLLEGGPQFRRQFVDWGAFYSDARFLNDWKRFRRALHQRNSLLKNHAQNELDAWDQELHQYGTRITERRHRYVQALAPIFTEIASHFLSCEEIKIIYLSGWDDSKDLGSVLKEQRQKDLRYGFTQNGPQRGDLDILINGLPAKQQVSRGQVKMIVIALLLSQAHLLKIDFGKFGCVLIDDLASELDKKNRFRLFEFLRQLKTQIFITATNIDVFQGVTDNNLDVLHVVGGRISHSVR